MKGTYLKFYTHDSQKHHGMVMYEWLLEFAKKNKIEGGSVFRAVAGYGRHAVMREEHFFELGSDVPIEVVFIMPEKEVEPFLDLLKIEKLDLLYLKIPVDYGKL